MTADEALTKRYAELQRLLRQTDTMVISGLTYDDIMHNVLISTLKRMRKKTDWDEEEAFEEFKKDVLMEFFFLTKRKSVPKILLADDLKATAKEEPFYENED